MKRYIPQILVGVNVLLALALAAIWITPQGRVRNTTWAAPVPQKPSWEVAALGVNASDGSNTNSFLYTLERPLFSPSRRPAPPAPVASAAAPVEVDPLANIQLQGVYSAGSGVGGIFAKVDGKNRRIAIGEPLGSWSIKEIDDRNVTLVRAGETRVLRLIPSKLSTVAPPVAALRPGGGAGSGAAASGQVEDPAVRAEQERQERERKRLEMRNANRAAAGLPLLSQ